MGGGGGSSVSGRHSNGHHATPTDRLCNYFSMFYKSYSQMKEGKRQILHAPLSPPSLFTVPLHNGLLYSQFQYQQQHSMQPVQVNNLKNKAYFYRILSSEKWGGGGGFSPLFWGPEGGGGGGCFFLYMCRRRLPYVDYHEVYFVTTHFSTYSEYTPFEVLAFCDVARRRLVIKCQHTQSSMPK